jgi:hypothetical protein
MQILNETLQVTIAVLAVIGAFVVVSFILLALVIFTDNSMYEPDDDMNPDDQYTYDRLNGTTNDEEHVIF